MIEKEVMEAFNGVKGEAEMEKVYKEKVWPIIEEQLSNEREAVRVNGMVMV